jgi:hypothetical protein
MGIPVSKTKEERAKRLAEVASLYLSGTRQGKIAEKMGVDPSQITYDIRVLHKKWKESSIRDFDEARGKELAKIDELEREYWEAWTRSQRIRQITSTKKKQGTLQSSNEASLRKEEHDGDPRFLQGVMSCIVKRCELLGLNMPEKVSLTDPTGTKEYAAMLLTDDERVARLVAVFDGARERRDRPTIN